jgi:hypothetical protein
MLIEPYGRRFTVRHLLQAGSKEHLEEAVHCLTDLSYLQGTLGENQHE